MAKTIYLGCYDNQNKRAVSPAGVTMMDYVINSIAKCSGECIVISTAQSMSNKLDREIVKVQDNISIIYRASLANYSKWNIFHKLLKKYINRKNIDSELNNIIDDGDTLVVYHSLALMRAVNKIRMKKNIKVVLHVCEIYADVSENVNIRKKEIDYIKRADAYIFSTKLLEEEVNVDHKEYAICLGTYTSVKDIVYKNKQEQIHVVYAGTLDSRKGGAVASANAAEFLPENYYLHILGFGNESEINDMKELIATLNKKCKCKISYDGCLSGIEYIKFIQNCDIGLSTQNPDGAFNSTSFPSKILSYMSNGLRVVSIRIPAIENSDVGKYMHFYDFQTPEKIAEAIMSINMDTNYDGRLIVDELNLIFCDKLKRILVNLNE
ncbi:MAG: glycosyltransferase family 4 protein [Clostridiales bacterium]|nr:glycosyltransferase family 4 protein [Clostridiales bacterium]